jgi:hypothetical protein
MAFYSKAWVLGCRIKIHGVAAVDVLATSPALMTALTLTTNGVSLGSTTAAVANGMCDFHLTGNSPDRFTHVQTVDVAKFMRKPRVLDDPQFFCTSGASPSQLIVAHFSLESLSGAVQTVRFFSELEFDVVFTDPIPFT